MDVFSHKTLLNEIKKIEELQIEEFINVKEQFYLLLYDNIDHIYYKKASILISVDYYNLLVYFLNKLLNIIEKVSMLNGLLLNKSCLRYDYNLNKYVHDIIKRVDISCIISRNRINFNIYFHNYQFWISSEEICPMDIRFLNNSKKINLNNYKEHFYHNYIPTIINQKWNVTKHKSFPEHNRKRIKEFVLIQFKFYRLIIPKDILFLILYLTFDYENVIYDPEFVDEYNFIVQKNTQVKLDSCESMKNQGFVDHLNLFIKKN